jgi:hypothetical protein
MSGLALGLGRTGTYHRSNVPDISWITPFSLQHNLWTVVDIWLRVMDLRFLATNCRAEVSKDNTTILFWQSKLACRVDGLAVYDFSRRGKCRFGVDKGFQDALALNFYEDVVGFYVYIPVNRIAVRHVLGRTCMHDLGFCMKVIKCEEHLRQPSFQQLVRETVRRVSVQEILEAIPHWFLDKTSMIATLSGNGKQVEGCPDVIVSWMRRIASAQDVVHVVLILVHSLSYENFQGRISMVAGLLLV